MVKQCYRHTARMCKPALDDLPVDLVADLANLLVLLGDEATLALLDISCLLHVVLNFSTFGSQRCCNLVLANMCNICMQMVFPSAADHPVQLLLIRRAECVDLMVS